MWGRHVPRQLQNTYGEMRKLVDRNKLIFDRWVALKRAVVSDIPWKRAHFCISCPCRCCLRLSSGDRGWERNCCLLTLSASSDTCYRLLTSSGRSDPKSLPRLMGSASHTLLICSGSWHSLPTEEVSHCHCSLSCTLVNPVWETGGDLVVRGGWQPNQAPAEERKGSHPLCLPWL